jgi:hypothetical protein
MDGQLPMNRFDAAQALVRIHKASLQRQVPPRDQQTCQRLPETLEHNNRQTPLTADPAHLRDPNNLRELRVRLGFVVEMRNRRSNPFELQSNFPASQQQSRFPIRTSYRHSLVQNSQA